MTGKKILKVFGVTGAVPFLRKTSRCIFLMAFYQTLLQLLSFRNAGMLLVRLITFGPELESDCLFL